MDLPELDDDGYAHGPVDDYHAPRYPFDDKVALVTGGSQGIGRHVAIGLARCGAKVAVVSRSRGGPETVELIAGDRTCREAGGEAHFIECDVSGEDAVKAAVDETLERYGALHLAVNNAGHSGENGPIEDQTEENYRSVFDTNVMGALFCLKHEIKAMRRNDPPPRRARGDDADAEHGANAGRTGYGRIVNIGSAAAFVSFPMAGIYAASKHALNGLTQAAAIELAPDTDIRVNMVVPGSVKTHNYELFSGGKDEMKAGMIAKHATQQILMPEDVVAATLFMLSDGAFFSVGGSLMIDGGFLTQ